MKKEIDNFNQNTKPKTLNKKEEKVMTYENANRLLKGRQKVLNGFKRNIFPIKATQGNGLKILTSKQILQRLPIALAQVKAVNTSERLPDEIRKVICFFVSRKRNY